MRELQSGYDPEKSATDRLACGTGAVPNLDREAALNFRSA